MNFSQYAQQRGYSGFTMFDRPTSEFPTYTDLFGRDNQEINVSNWTFPTRLLPKPTQVRSAEYLNSFNSMPCMTGVMQKDELRNISGFLFPRKYDAPNGYLAVDSIPLYSSENIDEESKAERNSTFKPKMDSKQVKGVEESIFRRKLQQLHELLDTISDDSWFFVHGKKKAHYFKHDRKTRRRSGYRGVSRNGASWQVLMMINNVKTYIGWYDTEEEGALVYDIVSILFKQKKARTNLSYSKEKLLDLLTYYDQDSKHFISEVPQKYIQELQMSAFE